jgi:hypothetical protein
VAVAAFKVDRDGVGIMAEVQDWTSTMTRESRRTLSQLAPERGHAPFAEPLDRMDSDLFGEPEVVHDTRGSYGPSPSPGWATLVDCLISVAPGKVGRVA